MEDRWLSVIEVVLYLGIKRDTVYKCGSIAGTCRRIRLAASGSFVEMRSMRGSALVEEQVKARTAHWNTRE